MLLVVNQGGYTRDPILHLFQESFFNLKKF